MSKISFKAIPFRVGEWNIIRLPVDESKQLPSRGIVMVKGSIDNTPMEAVLEPDGWGSHWLSIDQNIHTPVSVELESTKDWIEPQIPEDIQKALKANTQAKETWDKTTPQAHWEWVRWIRATNNTDTRARRIDVACSKLKSGMRRPCCFNASACTVPEVSKNGALLIPGLAAV